MRRVAQFVMCAVVGLGLLVPTAASAQTYVGGTTPEVQADNAEAARVLGAGGVADEPGSLGSPLDRAATEGSGGLLAFTGISLGVLLILGGGLAATGVVLKRRAEQSAA